jgi:hypothetical protein
MRAMYTNGHLIILEGAECLAKQPVPTETPRELVDECNRRLREVKVEGHDARSWQVRRTLAKNLIGEVSQ